MNKKMLLFIVMVAMAIIAAACGSGTNGAQAPAAQTEAPKEAATPAPEELTIKHKLGEAKLKKNPQKVVVFDYGVLDSLDKLGVEVTSVPQSSLPSYLEKYKDSKYVNAGTLFEPDFEKLNEIKPDVIFISGRAQDKYEELNKIAPTIFLAVDTTKYMDSFAANMKTLGEIFGKEKEVDAELAKINDEIKAVHDKAAASGKALVVLANEGKISAYGAGSRFGIIHDVLGFAQSDEKIEASTHGQSVTAEYIAEKNPDYLFVIDRGAAVKSDKSAPSGKQTIENDLTKNTNAAKNGRIVYLDPNYWYLSGGGLISVAEMVKEISAGIK